MAGASVIDQRSRPPLAKAIARPADFLYFRPMTDSLTHTSPFLVAALYHFVSVPRSASMQAPLQKLCEDTGVK
ncbi:hypothetical protein ACC771_07395, partial [Rhizobium ruizarguesonis]